MAEQLHRIKRQIIELSLSKKEATPAFYAQWRRLYDHCITPIIETCCSELVGSDQIIRIDRLELNLGELDFENIEADLQAKIRSQLREVLSEHLQVSAAEDAKQKNSLTISSRVELLTLFARQGILPWWADASKPTLLEDAMEALRKESGEVLRGLLKLLFQELTALKRIVRHFDDDILQGLCLLSQTTSTSLFENTRKTMLVLLGSSHLCRNLSSGQLRNILWDAMLARSYLTEGHSSSTPLFWQDVLSHLAGHIVVSSTVLMAELKQGFSLIAAPLDPAVFSLFERLFSKTQALDAQEKKQSVSSSTDDALQPKRLPLKQTDEMTQHLHDVAESPFSKTQTLDEQEKKQSVSSSTDDALQPKGLPLKQTDEMTQHFHDVAESPFSKAQTLDAQEKKQSVSSSTDDALQPKRLPLKQTDGMTQHFHDVAESPFSKTQTLDAQEKKQSVSSPTDDALQPKGLPLKQTDEMTQHLHDVAYGDADEIYIENAGLILLWPFLTQFFKHMKFIGKEGFNDHASLLRAVLLLQHIVTEQTEPAAYQLSLNRILCGMDLEAVFEQDDPVSEAEALECQTFLEAVIAQVPILKNMSVRGFRGTFLIRKGVLSIRDGLWLLRVERNDFDVVLDQFPWSVGWVKLPYMSQSMQVEW